LPFAKGFFFCALASLAIVLVVEKGRLFSRSYEALRHWNVDPLVAARAFYLCLRKMA
jgi:hypothetical protein